jgi:Cu(I)/Ag(I) efflux system membrane fusion protein
MSDETQNNLPESPEHFEEGKEKPPPGVELMALIRWMILIAFSALAFFMVARELGLGSPKAAVHEHKQQYTCPMHPQIIRDEPGLCPICSMDLVPVQPTAESQSSDSMPSTSEAPGLSEVVLTPERIQKIGLTTTQVTKRTFSDELESVGTIALDDSRMAEVHSRVEGFIEYIKPLRVGDSVKAGELLATLYSAEVEEAEREYLLLLNSTAINSHSSDGKLLEASKSRLKTMKISSFEIAAVEKAGKALPLSITAISSGTITEKNAVLGASVTPEMALFKTTDLRVVFALADIYERDLERVQLGQTVIVTSAARPGKDFEGKISFIYPSVNEATRTLKVRIELKNPDLSLLPGMFIKAKISRSSFESLVIPRDALIETGKHRYVFVVHPNGRFTPVNVEIGAQDGDFVEVKKGLSEGDQIVLSAGFLLDADSRLRSGAQ